jgi:hypothetical protein
MKNFIWFVFAIVALSVVSCQQDSAVVVQNSTNSLTKTSALTSLIKRVSQYETSTDNVLDNTSCFGIKLPVQVNVDSHTVNVTSANGYEEVLEIKGLYSDDSDIVTFTFPITIVYPDFHQVAVNNQSQLNSIITQCSSDANFHEIPCIDFNYPFSINIYNTQNQVSSTLAIQNDQQLYNLLQDLEDAEIVGIVYPVSLTKSNGEQVVMNNNNQLEEVINVVINDCNNSGTTLTLSDVLTSGTWHVSYCYYVHDVTSYYADYNFIFNANNSSVAIKNSVSINGNWDIHNESSYQRLDLTFDGSQLYDMENQWKVQEYTSTNIRLKHDQGAGSESYYLNLTKN